MDKPNFTQLQLALMEVGALPHDYKGLRIIMQKRFNLVDVFTETYVEDPHCNQKIVGPKIHE